MATNTVQVRATSQKTTTASAPENTPLPTGLVAGDLLLMFRYSGAGQLDATPTGWQVVATGDDGQGYHALYKKRATSTDVSAMSVTMSSTAAGKRSSKVVAMFSSVGDVVVTGSTVDLETVSTSAHSVVAAHVAGFETVLSFLGLKDTTTGVSGNYQTPTGMTTITGDSAAATAGVSQAVAAVAINSQTTGDVARGNFGGSGAWNVTAADGTTAVTSTHAVGVLVVVGAVIRPTADINLPPGANIVGGATMWSVLADDDPATYVEMTGGGTMTIQCAVNGIVPNFLQFDWTTDTPATSTSIHTWLDLAGVNLLDFGVDSTLITPSGWSADIDLTGLSSAQKSSILANPTQLRVRLVPSVS